MIRLIRFQPGVAIITETREANSNFTIWWEQVCDQIESSIGAIEENAAATALAQAAADQAQNDAIAAQGSAIDALADAAAAQTTANSALGTATTAVQQSVGPVWADATGTPARTSIAAYGGQAVSNPPTQAEVQAIDDYMVNLSQHVVAVINDLYANKSLTN